MSQIPHIILTLPDGLDTISAIVLLVGSAYACILIILAIWEDIV